MATKLIDQIFRLLLITITGWAGSVIVGLMVYGGDVFRPQSIAFAFVSFGLSGAFIFAFYHIRGLSNTITAAVVVSATQFIIASAWLPIMNAIIWSFGVNLPVVGLAFLFERKLEHFKQAKFTVVALVYGAMFVLLTLLVAVLTGVERMPAEVFRSNFIDGLLIGLGLGLGVVGGESFVHSLDAHRSAKVEVPSKK
jgi:hypothetical protein